MPRIGAHCGGSIRTALARAQEIGAEALQIFASSPHMWRGPKLHPPDVEAFVAGRQAADVEPLVIHAIYLINLASANEEFIAKSKQSIRETLRAADQLRATGLIVHVGSALKDPYDVAEQRAVDALRDVLDDIGQAKLLFETCAGQGATIGRSFAELASLIKRLDNHAGLGICLDTCHAFAAGYPIHQPEGVERMLAELDSEIGLARLACIHANDSKGAFASNVDRHANIGEGQLGEETFARLLAKPELRDVPFILEVPGDGDGPDRENVDRLKRLRPQ
jgi:deoxyribonuclease IV